MDYLTFVNLILGKKIIKKIFIYWYIRTLSYNEYIFLLTSSYVEKALLEQPRHTAMDIGFPTRCNGMTKYHIVYAEIIGMRVDTGIPVFQTKISKSYNGNR